MDALIFIAALLLVIGAMATLGDILRPVTDWLAPPPMDAQEPHTEPPDGDVLIRLDDGTVITHGQARQLERDMKRISRKPAPAPQPRALPDGMRAVRKLLEDQARTAKP